jgi:hypothetical protein
LGLRRRLCTYVIEPHVGDDRPELSGQSIHRRGDAQAERYRDDLAGQIEPIEIVLAAKDHDTRIDLNPSPKLRLVSYSGLISRARAELQSLKDEMARPAG